jgi:hypothetical protein
MEMLAATVKNANGKNINKNPIQIQKNYKKNK